MVNPAKIEVEDSGIGIAEAALDETLRYTRERVQFGQPIGEQPLVKNMLAGMVLDAAIVVLENVFRHLELGKSPKEAAVEGGADDVREAGTSFEITGPPENMEAIRQALLSAGIEFQSARRPTCISTSSLAKWTSSSRIAACRPTCPYWTNRSAT